MKNLVFIGPPGSGKGTQADIFSHTSYKFFKISAGDLLREEVTRATNLGKQIDSYIKEGNLVPDGLVCNTISKIIQLNTEKNLIFDGFPRRVSQAKKLDIELDKLSLNLDSIVNFDLSAEILYERIRNRRTCTDCKSSFNVKEKEFSIASKCIYCGGRNFFIRNDDKEDVFKRRMHIYEKENFEILEYYKNSVKIFTVQAENSVSKVTEDIRKFLFPILGT